MKKAPALALLATSALLIALVLTLAAGGWLWAPEGVRALQALGRWLVLPMRAFTALGDEQFYLIVIPLVYWCLDKGLGIDLGILLVLSGFTNTAVKGFVKQGRPFWAAPALRLADATSFSTPSGHAQSSAALYGQVACFGAGRRRRWSWIVAMALLTLLVALSRVYLGVHFPGDVLWGAAIGLGLLALYAWLKPALAPRLKRLPLAAHVLLALVAAAAVMGIVAGLLAAPSDTAQGPPVRYAEAWQAALEDGATVAGLTCGLWIGLVLEARAVRFCVAGPFWHRALRYLIGITGLAAIWLALSALFPQEPLALGLALRAVHYGLAMLWAIALWPRLFVQIGLAGRS